MSHPVDTPNSDLLPRLGDVARARLNASASTTVFALVTVAIIIGLWQSLITVFSLPLFVVPTPLSVGQALIRDWPELSAALGYTLQSTVAGLAVSMVLALALAALFTRSAALSRALMPIVITVRTAPVLAIAPILILMFGRGQGTSIAVVVIVTFFPIMVNATRGFQSAKANALELMHVLGASWMQTFFKVRFRFALPFIFTGLRTAAAGALLSAMLAEWLSGAPGIGTLILESGAMRQLPTMWAGVALSMLLAFLIFTLTVRIERGLIR